MKDHIQKIIYSSTNQWHMKRAKYLFEKQGFDVLPAAASYGSKGNLSAKSFIPDLGALNGNMVLLKEVD